MGSYIFTYVCHKIWCSARFSPIPILFAIHFDDVPTTRSEMRYLGIYFVAWRNMRCPASCAKRSFYRSSNAIFGKVGRHTSEVVILQLVKSKCMPMLLYGLECFALLKSDVKSIDFAVTRFVMKLFRTSNIDIINDCRSNFSFMLPSEMIEIRKSKFEGRFNICNSLRYYFGL